MYVYIYIYTYVYTYTWHIHCISINYKPVGKELFVAHINHPQGAVESVQPVLGSQPNLRQTNHPGLWRKPFPGCPSLVHRSHLVIPSGVFTFKTHPDDFMRIHVYIHSMYIHSMYIHIYILSYRYMIIYIYIYYDIDI